MGERMNNHKNMDMRIVWYKQGEYNKLVSAIEGNDREKVFDILFGINRRGDLK